MHVNVWCECRGDIGSTFLLPVNSSSVEDTWHRNGNTLRPMSASFSCGCSLRISAQPEADLAHTFQWDGGR